MHKSENRGDPLAPLKFPDRFGDLPERRDVFRKSQLVEKVYGRVFPAWILYHCTNVRLRVPVAVPRRVKEDSGDLKRMA